MATDELHWYIEQAALRGLLKEAREELLKAGWPAEDIRRILATRAPSRRRAMTGLSLALAAGVLAGWAGFYIAYATVPDIAYRQYSELGDEVVVSFPADVGETAATSRFSITPRPDGELVWVSDERQLHFVPYDGFDPEETYNVDVGLGWRSLLPPFSRGGELTFAAVRAEPIVGTLPPAGPDGGTQNGPVRSIDANLKTMQLTLLEDGLAVRQVPIAAIGNPYSGPTPMGSFDIKTKEPNHFSSKTHVWMPLSMQFYGDYFIHGWPYWPNGSRYEGRYSGGCIRLEQEVAEEVFKWATIGTALFVHDDEERSFAFSPSVLKDGDKVREGDSPQIYEVKLINGKKFKRRYFGDAGPVIALADGGLEGFNESQWVIRNHVVHEIDASGNRHILSCGKTPYSTEMSPDTCADVWELYGGDADELYAVSDAEWERLIPAPEFRLAVR